MTVAPTWSKPATARWKQPPTAIVEAQPTPAILVIGLLGVQLTAVGCAEPLDFGEVCPRREKTVTVVVKAAPPTTALAGCAQATELSALRATLVIEGHPSVDLAVDAESLAAQGEVASLETEESHPLVVSYALGEAPAHTVAFRWGVIDLMGAKCEQEEVSLDDAERLLIATPEVTELMENAPAGDSDRVGDRDALLFARDHLAGRGADLDSDGDDCPNLVEACIGTLSDPAHSQACQF